MANAKSRFVRILALALAVLMVVPMALVGCKKDEDGVNKEMLDAAIKEALDAAQAAQDAADKAASDAKDAQDKLDAAQKESDALKAEADKLKEESDKLKAEADKLKSEVESLKNTTTTKPAPTTTVKVQSDADKKVVDDYVAALLNDSDSELNKLLKAYGYDSKSAAVTSTTFSSVDQKSLAAIIADVLLAIQRAHTIDYANQLVASLKTTLDAVPTYSERIKEAYDAIDFASDKDVIDVVYAANLLNKALSDLDTAIAAGGDAKKKAEAEVKALKAFGEDKINLINAIATEYYRYTGDVSDIAKVAAVAEIKDQSEIKVLYGKAYAAVDTANIANQIRAIYNLTDASKFSKPAELKTANIVWADTLEAALDAVDASYKTWKNSFDNAAAKELYAELCIAFAGQDYILAATTDVLNEKLAAAKERFVQLEAAYDEYNKSSFKSKLEKIVTDYNTDGMNYSYTNKFTKYGVDYVDGLLSAWMSKYSFSATSANLGAIIGADKYNGFVAAKKYVNYINDWAVKAAALNVDAIVDALDEFADESTFSYNQYGAAIKALDAFLNGTKSKNFEDGLLDAKYNDKAVYSVTEATDDVDVDVNVKDIVNEVFGKKVELANINAIISYLKGDLAGYVADAKVINDAIAKLDPAKADFSYLAKINDIKTKINTLFGDKKMNIAYDMEDGVKVWDLDDINADLVNWDGVDALEAAYDAVRDNLMGDVASIVENYIAWKGDVTEDGTIKFGTFEIEADPFVVSIYSEKDMVAMKEIYNTLLDAIAGGVASTVTLDFVTVDEVVEDAFTLEQVVAYYREMSDTFYRYIMEISQGIIWNNSITAMIGYIGGGSTILNPWMPTDVATAASSTKLTAYAEKFGITYVYVKKGVTPGKKTDGSKVDVFNTIAGTGNGTYLAAVESVDPELFATYAGEDLDRRLVSFDKKAYGAAVKAAVDAAYTKWYSGANSDSTAFLCNEANLANTADLIQKNIKFALAFGTWNIADEFKIGDDTFSFKILPENYKNSTMTNTSMLYTWTPSLVVYNEDGEAVAGNKITVDKVEYEVIAKIGTTATVDIANYTFSELPQVEIYAKKADDTEVKLGKLLGKSGSYIYTWADSKDEVLANWATIGSVVQVKATGKYSVMTEKMYTKILEAYDMQKFYAVHNVVWNYINTLATKDENDNKTADLAEIVTSAGVSAIKQLATEYGVKYKKVSYSSMTEADLWKALKTFQGEANAIIAQHALPTPTVE